MFKYIISAIVTLFAIVNATGDFVVLHSPDSIIFKGIEEIDQSLLKDIFSAALGFTVKPRSKWDGMFISNPFTLPEAVVGIAVEGVDSLGIIKGQKFPLNVDEVEETTWQALSGRLEERDNDNSLVRIYLGDGLDALGQSALGELKPTTLDTTLKFLSFKNEDDRKFLEEVQLLHAIARKVHSAVNADNKSDVYWLVVSGLKPVIDSHGSNSSAAKEALSLLNEALLSISKAFSDAYENQVLITAFTNDASRVRHSRSIDARFKRDEKESPNIDELNLAPEYSDNYPVMFNIFLWFTVIFFFSLLAICIAIADMDPGRDSIIYRMTSNRMKKDN